MARIATPGVYLVEKNAFASSVVAVPTAVPAFVGYTEKALRNQTDLSMKPTRVTSFPEFIELFGGPPKTKFTIVPDDNKTFTLADEVKEQYYLFNSMRLFYENGGGICYIVSVGSYSDAVSKGKLQAGLDTLIKEQEPTMVVIPDAVLLEAGDCHSLYQQMILQCGGKLRSRVAILDVHEGHKENINGDLINAFREGVGNNNLAFANAYYPWVNTTVVESSDVSYLNIENPKVLAQILIDEAKKVFADPPKADGDKLSAKEIAAQAKTIAHKISGNAENSNFDEILGELKKLSNLLADAVGDAKDKILGAPAKERKGIIDAALKKGIEDVEKAEKSGDPTNAKYVAAIAELAKVDDKEADSIQVGETVRALSPIYKDILKEIREKMNLMPPSGAIAGVISMTDNLVGVFKAPANVSLSSVVSPAVQINAEEQEDLNMPINGKAVNAIRSFIGKGVLVWGARTMDGNSQDWKYINVRRTMIMLEQSIKNAIESYVFEPNVSRTWIKVKTSIDNFLGDQWRAGALAGATPSDAFEVAVGLGQTMTPEDILEGIMRVSVKVAITRPAEFIVITFQQKMQES